MSWRFLVPSLSIAPSPLAGLTACGAILVGIRSAWLQEPIVESFTDLRTWIDTVLVLTAATAAIAAPFTGIATRMTGELIFPLPLNLIYILRSSATGNHFASDSWTSTAGLGKDALFPPASPRSAPSCLGGVDNSNTQ